MRFLHLILLLLICPVALFWPVAGAAQDRYASIIVDADTLDILHARQIDAPRFPASLTKIMTLHVAFDAVERGEIALDTPVTVTTHAAATPPVKMGLKAGRAVALDTLIQAVAVRSANDAAAAIAEGVAGSEAAFVARMNETAARLGMRGTVFRNPHGLPDPEQRSTARDMAKLAQATLSRFPQHYHYFGQESFSGKRNTNALLRSRADVDGFKTGFTRASGYNLVISAVRDERRLIAVVMGGASSASRNSHMSDLVDRGFAVMNQLDRLDLAGAPARAFDAAPRMIAARAETTSLGETAPWALQIDGFESSAEAAILADTLVRNAGSGTVGARSRERDGRTVHSVRVEALDQATARTLCARHGEMLRITPRRCKVLSVAKPG